MAVAFEAPVRAMYFRAFMPPANPSGPASNMRRVTLSCRSLRSRSWRWKKRKHPMPAEQVGFGEWCAEALTNAHHQLASAIGKTAVHPLWLGIETEVVADGGHHILRIQRFSFDSRGLDRFGDHQIEQGLSPEFLRQPLHQTTNSSGMVRKHKQNRFHAMQVVSEFRPIRKLPIAIHEPIIALNRLIIKCDFEANLIPIRLNARAWAILAVLETVASSFAPRHGSVVAP